MTLGELKKALKTGTRTEAELRALKNVVEFVFSDVSLRELLNFQSLWNSNKPAAEFFTKQNEIICHCIDLEVSSFGVEVRKAMGLKPVTLETEV